MRTLRDIALWVWERELGKPYIWGGDDPLRGFDCSGLVVEGLKSVGKLPRVGDWTAADLAELFPEVESPSPGCLLFWDRGLRIGHVEIVWDAAAEGLILTLGASGGGSRTLTLDDAVRQNAYVMLRPAKPGWVRVVDPFMIA